MKLVQLFKGMGFLFLTFIGLGLAIGVQTDIPDNAQMIVFKSSKAWIPNIYPESQAMMEYLVKNELITESEFENPIITQRSQLRKEGKYSGYKFPKALGGGDEWVSHDEKLLFYLLNGKTRWDEDGNWNF